ncbi:carboxymuconolactone decarboxylase family protein [Mucilaginibacter agri]|uniref:Peroxidase-related enzyme n=1 Tax=Mucilaginibacter agri TaxID=2695265 RepID=A0A966DTU5_9SPHI|nr:peroxidase-related enzyme [Mucilaginibacter agri]NCD69712.1 peroxidase-related enzyme [Mucilaginibacter agri]
MPHINLPAGLPGIRSLFTFRPETAVPLNFLAQTLLHNPHPTLSAGERELIATYVSSLNDCKYCATIHGAIAKHQLNKDGQTVKAVVADMETSPVSDKLKALLRIAAKVQIGGKSVTETDVELAHQEGATDLEVHDTVLIAAAFCMYNRYVDGLATFQPDDEELYDQMGAQRAREGYHSGPLKLTKTEPVEAQ